MIFIIMGLFLIYETLIDEAMKSINSLPLTTGLFYTPLNNNGVELNLYDPQSKTIFATISAIAPAGDTNHVTGVAALKGFGPLIYEMGMMQSKLNGKWLAPASDGDVRGDAMNVWEKFYQRDDVEKVTLEPEDDDFSFIIIDGDEYNWEPGEKQERWDNLKDELYGESLEELQTGILAFNTKYSMEPNEVFKTLRQRGENSIINGLDPQIPQDAGSKLWGEMYE